MIGRAPWQHLESPAYALDVDCNPTSSLHIGSQGDGIVEHPRLAGEYSPSARDSHKAVCMQRLFIFGGFGLHTDQYNDVKRFCLSSRKWAPVEVTGAAPCPKGNPVCVSVRVRVCACVCVCAASGQGIQGRGETPRQSSLRPSASTCAPARPPSSPAFPKLAFRT